MNLIFQEVNINNLELACKIQNTIFPKENGRANFLEQINKDPYRKELIYYIVYLDEIPIGITGAFSYPEYPEDMWLGWFGVLKEYRNNGYGREILKRTIEIAKQKKYKFFRIYSDEYAKEAHRLYESFGFLKEPYINEDDKDEYLDWKIFIFSLNLIGEETTLWNNKKLGLKEQSRKEHDDKF